MCLDRLIDEEKLDLETTFYDGIEVLDNQDKARALLRSPGVLVFGSSTWAQGSNYLIRRYFELVGGEYLGGTAASAWATAGGEHTGGEVVVSDTLRSLMGMGAQVFTFGQKYMVFSTDERLGMRPGDFSLLDCWYMEQFGKTIAVAALARGDREKAKSSRQVRRQCDTLLQRSTAGGCP